jgi:hypothetical protein
MYRRAFLKSAAGDPRQPAPSALPLPHLPGLVEVAAAQTGAPQKRERYWAAPSAPSLTADSGDFVARALAILGEEAEAWQARQGADLVPRSSQ